MCEPFPGSTTTHSLDRPALLDLGFGGPEQMNENPTRGPRKSLLTALALVALAAGPARAQTQTPANDEKPAGAAAEAPPPAPLPPPPAALAPVPAPSPPPAPPLAPPAQVQTNGVGSRQPEGGSAGPDYEGTWFTR